MYRDAKHHVRHCESCQKFKTVQTKSAGKMLTRVVREPFDILCADVVGPLPRSKQGNSMLLVFHDVFSKWVELIPLRKATTAVVQKAFRERILGANTTDPIPSQSLRLQTWYACGVRETDGDGSPIYRSLNPTMRWTPPTRSTTASPGRVTQHGKRTEPRHNFKINVCNKLRLTGPLLATPLGMEFKR